LLERTQSSVILGLHYGLRIAKFEQPILHEVIDIQTKVTYLAANPQLPDFVPFLRYLPRIVSPWQRYVDRLYEFQTNLYMRLFRHGKDASGWNATKQALATAPRYASAKCPIADLDLAFTLATSVQGGMETSPCQLLWLFVAAIQHPDILTHAHRVLDEVVGRNRLPRFSDRSSLADIDAITHELFRWRPVSPGSIPRRADRADTYAGAKIAKGVTIMANAWAIGRDKQVFDSALGHTEEFVPERWLLDGKVRSDLPLPVFGQGRRICQGTRVATDGMFLNIAHLPWAFDIEAVEDETMDSWSMVVVGFMVEPKPFKSRLKPRGQWVLDVVRNEWEGSEKNLEMVMGTANDVEDQR
jgi:cytochrome P450